MSEKFIRDDWICSKMKSRESEFTQFHRIPIFCSTYNVNAKGPADTLGAGKGVVPPLPPTNENIAAQVLSRPFLKFNYLISFDILSLKSGLI